MTSKFQFPTITATKMVSLRSLLILELDVVVPVSIDFNRKVLKKKIENIELDTQSSNV